MRIFQCKTLLNCGNPLDGLYTIEWSLVIVTVCVLCGVEPDNNLLFDEFITNNWLVMHWNWIKCNICEAWNTFYYGISCCTSCHHFHSLKRKRMWSFDNTLRALNQSWSYETAVALTIPPLSIWADVLFEINETNLSK